MSMMISDRVSPSSAVVVSKRIRSRYRCPGLSLATFALLCNFGGCPQTTDNSTETLSLDIVFDRSGSLQSNGVFQNSASIDGIAAGDSSSNTEVRGFISVNLNSLPAAANVTRVDLQFNGAVSSGNPFGDFVTLNVDHVNVGAGIDPTDFDGSSITDSIATVPPLPSDSLQAVSIDVTSAVNADRAAGRTTSTFRLRFRDAPTVDGQGDFVVIAAPENAAALRPSALVTIKR